jgi:hypothetical protein
MNTTLMQINTSEDVPSLVAGMASFEQEHLRILT